MGRIPRDPKPPLPAKSAKDYSSLRIESMTIRQYFVAQAMCGCLTGCGSATIMDLNLEFFAGHVAKIADACLAQEFKTRTPKED
jgi:hypothetical protein